MTARSIKLMLLLTSAFGIACESNNAIDSLQPGRDPLVLTTLEVLPTTVTLEQGSTVQLSIVALDQRGTVMANVGRETFTTSDSAIATVSGNGMVTGVAAGTAAISVTKTVAGVTRSAAVNATIRPATPSAELVLTADLQLGWQPSVAHLAVGGTVQWLTAGPRSWSDVPHRMLYLLDKRYMAIDSVDLSTGSAKLRLMTRGEHRYCSAGCWDEPDFGIVHVH